MRAILVLCAAAAGLPCAAQQITATLLPVPALSASDPATEVPVTTIRGAQPGPTLALVAGNHGYEYPPILALQRLPGELRADLNAMKGTLLLVHIANVPGFLGRSLFVNPTDRKNLNRVYPGRKDGTQSERIAWVITNEVINRCDYLIDIHAGDGNESLRPYVYQSVTGKNEMDAKIAALASAFLFDHIVLDTERPADPERSVYCSNTAITRGKPAITVESGYLGTTAAESVDPILRGVRNVMRHLGMLPGTAAHADHPVFLENAQVIPSPTTGIIQPLVNRGHYAAKNAVLARITSLTGEPLAEIRAPFAGVVLYIIGTPPVNRGDPAVFLGRPVPDTPVVPR